MNRYYHTETILKKEYSAQDLKKEWQDQEDAEQMRKRQYFYNLQS